MIDVIDILQDCKSRDFGRDAGKETLWLLCIIAYHHELIIELRKESFYSFPESFVGPNRRTPILLVKPIRNFLSDFLAEAISQFATLIVLSPGDKIGEAICAFILQAMEQIVIAVDAENFRSGRKCEDFQIREPGDNTSTWTISEVIYTISGKFFEQHILG